VLAQTLDQVAGAPSRWARMKSCGGRLLVAGLVAAVLGVAAYGVAKWHFSESAQALPAPPHPDAFTPERIAKWRERFKDDQVFLGKLLVQGTHPTGTLFSTSSVTTEPCNEGKEIAASIVVKWDRIKDHKTEYVITISKKEGFLDLVIKKDDGTFAAKEIASQNTKLLIGEYVNAVSVEMKNAEKEEILAADAGKAPKTLFDDDNMARLRRNLESQEEEVARVLLAGTHPTGKFIAHGPMKFKEDARSLKVSLPVTWQGPALGKLLGKLYTHETKYELVVKPDNAVSLLKPLDDWSAKAISADHLKVTETILQMKVRTMAVAAKQ